MYESFMRRAIALSCQGVEAGGGPFGAVVVKDGAIIGEGMNQVSPMPTRPPMPKLWRFALPAPRLARMIWPAR